MNIPWFLKGRLDQDPVAAQLLEKEGLIVAKMDSDASGSHIYLRRELDAHRQQMTKRPVLQELLSLREGQPISIERL